MGERIDRKFFGPKIVTKTHGTTIRIHLKIRPKIDENRVRRHPRAPKSTSRGTEAHSFRFFFGKTVFAGLAFETILGSKTVENGVQKIVKKRVPPKSYVFEAFCDF